MQKSKTVILPKLALVNLRKNTNVYLPYILTLAFMVAVFFSFDSISRNELMETLPYAGYVQMLMIIGEVLLGIIIAPFLFYTNSILMKRRKRELGLYSILGLEKKHIGMMMCVETLFILVTAFMLGFCTAVLFSNVLFGALMKISGYAVKVHFSIKTASVSTTFLYFAFVCGANLFVNLLQVSMANPTELLQTGKKGEKEIKHIAVPTILGLLTLGAGYFIALTAKMDGFIFTNFFLAVFLVVIGTYFLITAGSISLLKRLKKSKHIYYKKENFVTISGMLYRMKKNAASLVNICVFATMVMITLICTISLKAGQEKAIRFLFPYDARYQFTEDGGVTKADFEEILKQEAKKQGVSVTENIDFTYREFEADVSDDALLQHDPESVMQEDVDVRLLTLEEFNEAEGVSETLGENEVLFYSSIADFGKPSVILNGAFYKIKQELTKVSFDNKEPKTYVNRKYYIVMKDESAVLEVLNGYLAGKNGVHMYLFNMEGEDSQKTALLTALTDAFKQDPGYYESDDVLTWGAETHSMNGGLLFLGVFFSIVFTMCFILIMYYKQIAKGLEDRQNFAIMKQVGMSSDEVRSTIKRQILLIFFLPLIGALLHTLVSLNMVMKMLSAIHLYEDVIYYCCAGLVAVVFLIIYNVCYLKTAKVYYKIVNE